MAHPCTAAHHSACFSGCKQGCICRVKDRQDISSGAKYKQVVTGRSQNSAEHQGPKDPPVPQAFRGIAGGDRLKSFLTCHACQTEQGSSAPEHMRAVPSILNACRQKCMQQLPENDLTDLTLITLPPAAEMHADAAAGTEIAVRSAVRSRVSPHHDGTIKKQQWIRRC